MLLNYRQLLCILLGGAFLFGSSCQCSRTGDASGDLDIPDSLLTDRQVAVSQQVIESMVENISSPVETAALIKRLKVPFNKDSLVPTDASFSKAVGLGLYGTDLGYLNMYEKTSSVLSYISAVKSLADGIQVGQFFDFSTLKRLATNNENLDSLIYISQESYNKIDAYLRSTNRGSLSVVIISGVWIEGMYISTQVARLTKNKQIEETITDQKVVLATLIPMLRLYEKDANIQSLADRLEKLKGLYDKVKITYVQGDPVSKVVDGVLTFEQKDRQIVEASPEVVESIFAEIEALRSVLISNN